MRTAEDIITDATDGEPTYWSRDYAKRVLASLGFNEGDEEWVEGLLHARVPVNVRGERETNEQAQAYDAAMLLTWLGF